MKKRIKMLVLYLILCIPITIKCAVGQYTTYSNIQIYLPIFNIKTSLLKSTSYYLCSSQCQSINANTYLYLLTEGEYISSVDSNGNTYLSSINPYFCISNSSTSMDIIYKKIDSNGVQTTLASEKAGIRPVAYLNINPSVTGNGTINNPYVISGSENVELVEVVDIIPYVVTLDKQSGNGGTSTIYVKYGVNWYLDSDATSNIIAIVTPTKSGYTFDGYYTNPNGSGIKIIDSSGIVVGETTVITSATTLYANWIS